MGLARLPAKWNYFAGKKSRQIECLEPVLVAKMRADWWNGLSASGDAK
jgi:hypothetical protein